ncbi:hypothetical protein [Streptomyces sp. NPDC048309]|uniref:hypothetical protein n=1 Tax=unclassified Streptomyces TaxID=2593676 RepID=UPI00340C09B4
MNAQRARRLVAVSAVGVLLAGGAAIGAAGTASAAVPAQNSNLSLNVNRNCGYGGWWNDCNYGYGRGDRGDFYRSGFNGGFGNGGFIVIVVR